MDPQFRAKIIQKHCSLFLIALTAIMLCTSAATFAQRIGDTYSSNAQTDAALKSLSPAAQAVMEWLSTISSLPIDDLRYHERDLLNGASVSLDDSSWKTIKMPFTASADTVWLRRWIEVPKTFDGYSSVGAKFWLQARSPRSKTWRLEINYTPLSLINPHRVHFRYNPEGFDMGWQEAGSHRDAIYSQLTPDRYRFHVASGKNDRIWDETGAEAGFMLLPTFLQSPSSKIFLAVIATALIWLLYLMRLWQVKVLLNERLAERARIASDLHDDFFQGIEGVLLRFHTATSRLNRDEPALPQFEEAFREFDRVIAQSRELVFELRAGTCDLSDLRRRLTVVSKQLESISTSTTFTVNTWGISKDLCPVVSEELLKIAKEAMWNALRHANARAIWVHIDYQRDQLVLEVIDNGNGIESEILLNGARTGHWGLLGMRERASKIGAHFEIKSSQRIGTDIVISVPSSISYRTGSCHLYQRWQRSRRGKKIV